MKFSDYLALEKAINVITENVIDDVYDMYKTTNQSTNVESAAVLLFYVRKNRGSLGDVGLKAFYKNDNDLLSIIKTIKEQIVGHEADFKAVLKHVHEKNKEGKMKEIYGEILRFFEQPARMAAAGA